MKNILKPGDESFAPLGFIVVGFIALWAFLSWLEETLLGVSNSVIEALTPMGVSLVVSIVIFVLSIKHIKLMTQILGAFFTKTPSAQKKIAVPVFVALIVTVALIKGTMAGNYAQNVQNFYIKSNNFVKKTSYFNQHNY